jgi:hypothetical protein
LGSDQGSVGFGLALVVVPVLALVRPQALPAVVLSLALPRAQVHDGEGVAFRRRAWLAVAFLAGTEWQGGALDGSTRLL